MLFIAEIGLNHNGNFDIACEMMRQAKISGADIVKMQLGWKGCAGQINCIDHKTMERLFRYSDFLGIELMFSLFNRDAFNMIQSFPVKRYKIASRTVVDDIGLVKDIVNSKKEVIISLGMWEGAGVPIVSENVRYLWCKSIYPAMPWDLVGMPKKFSEDTFFGYSDHSLGIDSAILAICRGAKIIEKHFTLDKSDTTIRDHVLSATPDEFANLVIVGREISKKIDLGV